jgi:hypothetical protein
VRVDGQLPTWSWGGLAYADSGAQGSIWVGVIEKAYALFRYNAGSYVSIEGGWMSEVYRALGRSSTTQWGADSGQELLQWIDGQLRDGRSVTFATYYDQATATLVGGHAYTVDRVEADADGNLRLVLRNPWGIDGAAPSGANDGYVTLTAAQAVRSCWAVTSAAL